MPTFAKDHRRAEEGTSLPLSSLPAPIQPPAGQMSGSPRPATAASAAPAGDTSTTGTTGDYFFVAEKFRCKDQVDKHQPGWPRFEAMQDFRQPGGIYRRFGKLYAGVLLHKQSRLANLVEQLEEYANDPAANNSGLTAGQTRRVGDPYVPDRRDMLIDEIEKELFKYGQLQELDRNTQTFLTAYKEEVEALYRDVVVQGMIDEPGLRPVYAEDDFLITSPKLNHNGIRPLLYTDFGKWMLKPILEGRAIDSAHAARVLQTLLVLFVLFMILTPVGFVYLSGLSAAASYGLVVGFGVLFCFSFAAADTSFEHFLVGVCAYVAVLISILDQTQGAGACSCS